MKENSSLDHPIIVIASALAGGWFGTQFRSRLQGEPTEGLLFRHETNGLEFKSFPIHTLFLPALIAARIARPRALFAFLGGFLAGSSYGQRLEERLYDKILPWLPLPQSQPQAEAAETQP
jgi:hypothetical protein